MQRAPYAVQAAFTRYGHHLTAEPGRCSPYGASARLRPPLPARTACVPQHQRRPRAGVQQRLRRANIDRTGRDISPAASYPGRDTPTPTAAPATEQRGGLGGKYARSWHAKAPARTEAPTPRFCRCRPRRGPRQNGLKRKTTVKRTCTATKRNASWPCTTPSIPSPRQTGGLGRPAAGAPYDGSSPDGWGRASIEARFGTSRAGAWTSRSTPPLQADPPSAPLGGAPARAPVSEEHDQADPGLLEAGELTGHGRPARAGHQVVQGTLGHNGAQLLGRPALDKLVRVGAELPLQALMPASGRGGGPRR